MKNIQKLTIAILGISALSLFPMNTTAQAAPVAVVHEHVINGHERHPEIRAAIHALENAKRHLQEGAHDFDGHRAAAVQLIDQALAQCNAALAADRH